MDPEFWTGKKLLITGSCGFLGKLVLEKVLRCLPEVDTIFLLIREKNNSPQQRLLKMLGELINKANSYQIESPVFVHLQNRTDFLSWALSKIVVIEGDMRQNDLGITKVITTLSKFFKKKIDLERLLKVNIVIHCAATSDFNAPLDVAVQTNVIVCSTAYCS
jgi:thioester reductase-like protein